VTVAAVEAAAADYRSLHTSTAGYKFEWELLIGQAQTRRQGILMEDVNAAKLTELRSQLSDE